MRKNMSKYRLFNKNLGIFISFFLSTAFSVTGMEDNPNNNSEELSFENKIEKINNALRVVSENALYFLKNRNNEVFMDIVNVIGDFEKSLLKEKDIYLASLFPQECKEQPPFNDQPLIQFDNNENNAQPPFNDQNPLPYLDNNQDQNSKHPSEFWLN